MFEQLYFYTKTFRNIFEILNIWIKYMKKYKYLLEMQKILIFLTSFRDVFFIILT